MNFKRSNMGQQFSSVRKRYWEKLSLSNEQTTTKYKQLTFFPPAFRRNGEGNVFTGVYPFTFAGRGVPHPADLGGIPFFPTRGIPPSFLTSGGYPILPNQGESPSQVGVYPHPRSGWGVPPSQVWTGGYPHPGQG